MADKLAQSGKDHGRVRGRYLEDGFFDILLSKSELASGTLSDLDDQLSFPLSIIDQDEGAVFHIPPQIVSPNMRMEMAMQHAWDKVQMRTLVSYQESIKSGPDPTMPYETMF